MSESIDRTNFPGVDASPEMAKTPPIFLEGMKVLFDETVSLYPVRIVREDGKNSAT